VSRLDLIVGPNGAGKTTFFERMIEPDRSGLPFVNADRIAVARFGPAAERMSYEAATLAAKARAALIDARLDFCAETVFSHDSKLDELTVAINAGYEITLTVIMIPLELSTRRVIARVAAGGHSVPLDKLAGRYARLWPNVAATVPRCHRAVFWDNSSDGGTREVAAYRLGVEDYPPRWPTWTPVELTAL